MRNQLAMLMTAVALATSAPSADAAVPAADASPGVTTIGRGADQVLVMRPAGPARGASLSSSPAFRVERVIHRKPRSST
jgi:hypothetical protein